MNEILGVAYEQFPICRNDSQHLRLPSFPNYFLHGKGSVAHAYVSIASKTQEHIALPPFLMP